MPEDPNEKTILDKAQEVAKDVAEKAKDVATTVKEKVSDFVGGHEDQIHSGIDKTSDFVDDKTGGRFSEKIDKAQGAAKDAVHKVAGGEETEGEAETGTTGTTDAPASDASAPEADAEA